MAEKGFSGDSPSILYLYHTGLHTREQIYCFVVFSTIAELHRFPGKMLPDFLIPSGSSSPEQGSWPHPHKCHKCWVLFSYCC